MESAQVFLGKADGPLASKNTHGDLSQGDGPVLAWQMEESSLMAGQTVIKVEIEQKTQGLSNKRATSRADDERIRKLYGQQKCRACTFVTLQILGS